MLTRFCLVVFLSVVSVWVLAEERSDELNPIVVTASPLAHSLDDGVQSVSVLGREEIESLPVTSIEELLALVAGVDVRRRGVAGVQADLGIRGSSYEQTLVLIDGVPMKDPQTGHHDLNLPVPLAHIERIEIVRGPGGLAFGGNATGGLVNIITRRPTTSGAGLEVRYGTHDTWRLAGQATLAGTRSGHMLSLSHHTSDGHLPEDRADADLRDFLYSGNLGLDNGRLFWGLAAQDKEFGAWKFYTADFPDQREETETRTVWAGGEIQLGRWQIDSRLRYRAHDDWFRTRVGDLDFINEHETEVRGWQLGATTALGSGTAAIGASVARDSIESNALGRHSRNEYSFWTAHRQPLGERVEIEVGTALADYSDYDREWLPSVGLRYALSSTWTGFGSVGRTVRIPSYIERFLVTSGNRGNPDLVPERSVYSEVGLRHVRDRQRFSVALFDRRTRDLIDWGREPGAVTWQGANFDGHRTRGSEVEWLWRAPLPHGKGSLRLAWTWLDTELDNRGQEIKYALDHPRHALSASGAVDLAAGFGLSLSARYGERRHGDQALLLAVRLSRRMAQVSVFVEGENLLDERIIETGFAPLPGRLVRVGLSAEF